MTLRQLWVRVKALPPDSPLHVAVTESANEAAEVAEKSKIDNALDMIRR